MIDSFFTRFRPTTDTSDCDALGEDPEWNELVAWAGVKADPRSGSSVGARDEGSSDADPNTAAGEIGPDETEDWEQVIAQAKANTPAPVPLPLDDISTRRARAAGLARQPRTDHGLDSWDLALLRAKRR